jgi:hypothetical protein
MLAHDEIDQLRGVIRAEIEAEGKATRREIAAADLRAKADLARLADQVKSVDIAVAGVDRKLDRAQEDIASILTTVIDYHTALAGRVDRIEERLRSWVLRPGVSIRDDQSTHPCNTRTCKTRQPVGRRRRAPRPLHRRARTGADPIGLVPQLPRAGITARRRWASNSSPEYISSKISLTIPYPPGYDTDKPLPPLLCCRGCLAVRS